MAEILLSDYFAEHGGAANDAADCTPSILAALQALNAAGGGVLEFPSGICRLKTKLFYSPYVPITLKGTNDSFIRFGVGGIDRFFNVEAQENILSFENLTFIGRVPQDNGNANQYDATINCIWARAKIVFMRHCRFLGLAISGANPETDGVIGLAFSNAVIEQCQFDGCSSPSGGVIRGYDLKSLTVRDSSFVDWVTSNGIYYSKTPLGNFAWINASSWHVEGAANQTRRLKVENCWFDEGTSNGIMSNGGDSVHIEGVGINFGTASGIHLKNTRDVRINQSWCGYMPFEMTYKRGIILENVERARIEGWRNGTDKDGTNQSAVRYVELGGTTKRVTFDNCTLGGTPEYPNGVYNPANALLEIDGVKYRNGMIAY